MRASSPPVLPRADNSGRASLAYVKATRVLFDRVTWFSAMYLATGDESWLRHARDDVMNVAVAQESWISYPACPLPNGNKWTFSF